MDPEEEYQEEGGDSHDDYGPEYHYDDWEVDQVDLNFKTVSDLKSLLSDRRTDLSYNLYKVSDQIDAKLREQLKTLNTNQHNNISSSPLSSSTSSSTSQTSNSNFISREYSFPISTTLSSTTSIQENTSFSSNQSSNLTEANQSGQVKTFPPPLPTDEAFNIDYTSILINLCFLILLLLIIFFVINQCREAFKQRSEDFGLPFYSSSTEQFNNSKLNRIENIGNPHDLVVKVDSSNNIPHHHMLVTPLSPISILQNSPLYSPVKESPVFLTSNLHVEDEAQEKNIVPEDLSQESAFEKEEETKISPVISIDMDEGIESEEDIDGFALKQLIKENVTKENFNRSYFLVYSSRENEEYRGKTSYRYRSPMLGNSLESPSISLCSDGLEDDRPDFWNSERAGGGIEECLI